jgi:selenide,water dikinase
MPQGQLAQVLRELTADGDGRLLVGPRSLDDAGVVLLGEAEGLSAENRLALVQTVDFFPPIVDDPRAYGAIAAANALSDVYAMGGRPLSVLNLAGFPGGFPAEWVREIFRGGFEKVREAGAVLAGGHTVESAEPLFGFAVTGVVHADRVVTNSGARAGDRLYLTKSLGMGVVTTAAKKRKLEWVEVEPAARQMATLNAAAAEAMQAAGATACTDVTGFGLMGHASNIARESGVSLRFSARDLPLFPGALELARKGHFSGGMCRGRQTLATQVTESPEVEEALRDLAFDAESSGGLLIAVPAERAKDLESELRSRSLPVHAVGEVLPRGTHLIELH